MQTAFNPARGLESAMMHISALEADFRPDVRIADPRFGDFQANGVLPYAKARKGNPRAVATEVLERLNSSADFAGWKIDIAGPGFINFAMSPEYLLAWLNCYRTGADLARGLASGRSAETVIVDFSSPNTAKEMHVGHIRSTVIGEAIARLFSIRGDKVIRDNHIGDWGTQFGMLIWAVKNEKYDLAHPGENVIAELQDLYAKGYAHYKESDEAAVIVREELLKLQNGDAENLSIWKKITEASKSAFDKIYSRLGIKFDLTLGESFYRDKVERIYRELTETGLAVESDGALVVFHPEHKRFATQPFIIRKGDGASNYATTDLATILYRVEELGATDIIYVVDSRQSDHFEQLFLTVQKWFAAKGYRTPRLRHISFGTVLGENGKPFKTKEGGTVKLRDLLDEAVQRSYAIVTEKNPDLPEEERRAIAEAVGVGSVRYADLSQNRTSDYVFSWDKMLALEGNTAPYLLYAVARIRSIFRKAGIAPGEAEAGASAFETPEELALARKLAAFGPAMEGVFSDTRPHLLASYLYELSGTFSSFYSANRVMVDEAPVRARRILLSARTLSVMETGLSLLGLKTLERM
ncbi:MAG TPA: arginine--tRNA ligase [Opitutales bacterium]|nr:arginine--tRNA ligase [Opitutales bacterium]